MELEICERLAESHDVKNISYKKADPKAGFHHL